MSPIRVAESEQDWAVVRMAWTGGGLLECPGGRRYTWRLVSFWRQEHAFRDEYGRDLVRARTTLSGKIRTTLDPMARRVPEFSLLVLLAAYLLLLASEDAAAAAAVAAAS